MRKVRVWDDALKEMLYGRVEQFDDMLGFRFEKHLETENPVYMWETGLKDKNKKEIYEGDILTSEHYPFQDEGKYNYHGVIEWIDECAAFYMTKRLANNEKRGISDGIAEPIEEGLEEFEIIGNIYENQELLKGDGNDA